MALTRGIHIGSVVANGHAEMRSPEWQEEAGGGKLRGQPRLAAGG
jgi:hypothetical protein